MRTIKRKNRGHIGKVGYQTKEIAQKAARHMLKRKAKQGNEIVSFINAYPCRCGKWHIGKSRRIDWSKV